MPPITSQSSRELVAAVRPGATGAPLGTSAGNVSRGGPPIRDISDAGSARRYLELQDILITDGDPAGPLQ